MRIFLVSLLGTFASAFDKAKALEAAMDGFNVRSSWEDGFVIYAQMLMQDSTGMCATLNACVQEMSEYFKKIIQDDKTNTYVTLAWCGKPSDAVPDAEGNVWWYDGWDTQVPDKPYYVIDAVQTGRTNPCGTMGMIMRGVEVDNSISIYASPDYIHTKWNISHEKPQFDYTPAVNCIPTANNNNCADANPCGKADELHKLWRTNVEYQVYGKAHMVISMCQKGGGWNANGTPNFSEDPQGMVAAEKFAPLDYGNTIDEHIEWDKAPKDSSLGDGEGWEPFKFSQCCSTLVIAPQI